jgi:HSP20 family protein
MAKKTQSATGQQAQTEQPDQAEQKLPAGQQGGERTRSGRTFRPRVDIRETERGLVLLADVPGARPDGLTITLDRRALNVHAQVEDHAPASAQSTRNTRSVISNATLRCRATSTPTGSRRA